jgi:protein-disulfide isomerase
MLPYGHLDGNPHAPVKLIEFLDLECPACRAFHHDALHEARARFGDSVSITYVHYPLRIHRFAKDAARAAECAAISGMFARVVDAVFAKQDSLGLKGWGGYARDAGVPDSSALTTCMKVGTGFTKIDSGLALAGRKRILGTPTLFLNGWRFDRPPSAEMLSKTVTDLLAGRKPGL